MSKAQFEMCMALLMVANTRHLMDLIRKADRKAYDQIVQAVAEHEREVAAAEDRARVLYEGSRHFNGCVTVEDPSNA